MREEIKKAIDDEDPLFVSLGKMRIKDDELQEIAEYIIQTHPQVKQVLLGNNPITDKGATILATALMPLVGIEKPFKSLDLSHTLVGEQGCQALCEGLVRLNPSFFICLYGCKWQDRERAFDLQQAAIKKFYENQEKKKVESHRPSTPPDEPSPPSSSKRPRTK